MKYFISLFSLTLWNVVFGQSFPPACDDSIVKNPLVSDLVTASEHVSWDEYSFYGKKGVYVNKGTCEMHPYDTRMRVYERDHEAVIVFRPTQQNPQGGSIHGDRYVTPSTFLSENENKGSVHNHFQEAFKVMNEECRPLIESIREKDIYVTGHSLGGAFSLFMAASLVYDYHVEPKGVYGFAGTFIGDEVYHHERQKPLHSLFPMWLIESVDINNPGNKDGTCEGYQTFDNRLFIDRYMICGFYVHPLGPDQSYGMHDLKNYWLAVQSN